MAWEKVVVKRCSSYALEDVKEALERIFSALGGLQSYVKPGMHVVLKPNLVMKKRPEDAATTHPTVVEAVADMVVALGASVTIADSPGGLYTERSLRGVYQVCGLEKLSKKHGIQLNYDTRDIVIENPQGMYIRKLNVIKPLVDADLVINLPKLKTHGQMVYTGGVKNMFGSIPGVLKAEYHFRLSDYDEFANALIDIFLSIRPQLTIMDAVVGMEGDGPTAGNPRELGFLMGSTNAFCLDRVAAEMICSHSLDIPILKNAVVRGLCPADIHDIVVEGEPSGCLHVRDFHMPQLDTLRTISFYNRGILKHCVNWMKPKPVFQYKKCIGCGECERSCPAGVVTVHEKKPVVELSGCIRCFCCQELCPAKAVVIKRSYIIDAAMKMSRFGKLRAKAAKNISKAKKNHDINKENSQSGECDKRSETR